LIQDLRLALRSLVRSPGFAVAAVATLALGIGANTAIFSLINAVLLEPLPYPDSARLAQVWFTTSGGPGLNMSVPEFRLLLQETSIFEAVTAYDFGGPGINITGAGEPEQVKAIHASEAYFRLFGARTAAGRTFTADEDRPQGGRVVVLSHGLWQRRFHGDPNLAGKTISLGNEPYLVAGVLARDFRPDPAADVWLPLQADFENAGQAHYLRIAARLRPGVSWEQANARLRLTAAALHREFPRMNQNAGFEARPLRETNAGGLRTALLVLFGTVVLVLLIACSNVANLLLARATSRRREVAIRAALGATRGRLVGQFLTESLVIAVIGGVCGLAAGRLCVRVLAAWTPDTMPDAGSLDWRMRAFTAAISLGTCVLFGLLPALRASRAQFVADMRETAASIRAKSLLVGVQLALAVVLAVGAGLMIRTFSALRSVDPGIDPHHVLTLDMSLEGTRFHDTATLTRMVDQGVARVEQIPGVTAAATTWTLPVDVAFSSSFIIEGRPLGNDVVHGGALMRPVSPNFTKVFGIPMVEGRFFTARDSATSPAVAVISEAMARKFWPRSGALGERISLDKHLGPDFAAPPREIVGIARDVHDLGIDQALSPLIYIPQSQVANGMTRIDGGVLPLTWAVRTAGNPYTLSAAIQHELRDASGGLAVAHIRSMEEVVRHSTAQRDFNGVLLTAFAAAALLLAAVGVYGLIVFSVQQRSRELGIRLALGAAPAQLRRMVLRDGLVLALAGVVPGAAASVVLSRLMRTLIYGVQPVDPLVIATASVILVLVAALASYVPAHRAAKLDPVSVLRSV